MAERSTYHDVVVTLNGSVYRLFNESYSYLLTCTRAGGWELWGQVDGKSQVLLGGEFQDNDFSVIVKGNILCETKSKATQLKACKDVPPYPQPDLDALVAKLRCGDRFITRSSRDGRFNMFKVKRRSFPHVRCHIINGSHSCMFHLDTGTATTYGEQKIIYVIRGKIGEYSDHDYASILGWFELQYNAHHQDHG